MGTLKIMGRRGDDRLEWEMTDPARVKAAEAMFTDLTGKGYRAFAVGPDGGQAEPVSAFDPTDEELILVPPMRGGQARARVGARGGAGG